MECLRFYSDSKKHLWQFSVRLFSHKINSETIVKLLRFWDTEFRVCDLHESHITRFYFYESLPFFVYHYNTIQRNAIQYNTIQYKFYCQLPMGAFQRRKTKNRMDSNEAPEVYKIGRTCLFQEGWKEYLWVSNRY